MKKVTIAFYLLAVLSFFVSVFFAVLDNDKYSLIALGASILLGGISTILTSIFKLNKIVTIIRNQDEKSK